jgi:hypothetical protein
VDRIARALGGRRAGWLPVLVDGAVLGRAAREAITILRGNWNTARRVHTPDDTVGRLTLEGVREVAKGVAAAVR